MIFKELLKKCTTPINHYNSERSRRRMVEKIGEKSC